MRYGKSTRNRIILSVSSLVPAIVMVYIFLSDFSEFNMPNAVVASFYMYTAILLLYTVLAVVILKRYDSRYPSLGSPLKNYLRLSLGFLWLLDGILQIQPEMSFGFVPFVLVPALQSLPAVLQPVVHPLILAWTSHGSLMDAASAVLQVFLGLSLLTLKSRRFVPAIAGLSMLWAIAIWVFGEDLGSPAIGMSILTGFPGAATLYAIPSAVLAFNFGRKIDLRILRYTFAAVFTIAAILQAIPANGYWGAGSIAAITGSNAYIFEPRGLALFLYNSAVVLSNNAVPWNLLLTVALFGVGISWIIRPLAASRATLVISAIIWVIGQDFGIFGGYGTDPNTALVMFLLSLSLMLVLRKKAGDEAAQPYISVNDDSKVGS